MRIADCTLKKFEAPIGRLIGDSQVNPISEFEFVVVELTTATGERGVGFERINLTGDHTISIETLASEFAPVSEGVVGESPFSLRNRLTRPRGGNLGSERFTDAVDIALWDLCGRSLDFSVARLMGAGPDPDPVPAYASGISFPNDDESTRQVYREFSQRGFSSAKVKVGFPTIQEDIKRLELVQDVMGEDGKLMVDANEAFSPKEAIRRLKAYRGAGFDVYWFEDPVLRTDIDGIKQVERAATQTLINVGEYVGEEHTARMLERGAADIVNLRGLSSGLTAARLANTHGRPLAVGNTPGDVGVHLAAAVPEMTTIEWSKPGWGELLESSVTFEDGQARVPDGPGHGLTASDTAFEQFGTTVFDQ